MKKLIAVETLVLVILLAVAVYMCVNVLKSPVPEEEAPPMVEAGPGETIPEETTTEEVTEPEPTWLVHEPGRELLAKQYFVYDVDAEKFLTISGEETETIYPASVTKLFTCYVALQYLEPEEVLTVGDEMDFVVYGSSVADLRKGDKLTVSQLVEAMLLPSGNDAAYVLAVNAGRRILNDKYADFMYATIIFMEEMNSQVQELGMVNTHFANPDGIHSSDHFTCFSDLATLAAMSIKDETIMKNAVIANDTVTFIERGALVGEYDPENENLGDTVKWKNTNELIDPNSKYYCPYATGLKTGQTPYAGSCLLSSFHYEGKTYIIGVFGCPEKEDRFDDTLQLFNETINK